MIRGKRQGTRGKRQATRGLALNPRSSTHNRLGTTLSEILISLMVMSIGVVSLATLFPISVLRSIQASQLTNGTILRQNVEQITHVVPTMVHNPANFAPANLLDYETLDNPNLVIAGEPDNAQIRYIVDPNCYLRSNYPPAILQNYGNDGGAALSEPIHRYSGNFSDPNLSYLFLPDNWQLLAKGMITGSTANQITIPTGVDLNTAEAAVASGVQVRVTVTSQNGRSSEIRPVLPVPAVPPNPPGIDPTARQINWDPNSPLPANGQYTNPSRFRLEARDLRYSWLLTVRKGATYATSASYDVVVFFNRSFKVTDEQVYFTDVTNGYSQGSTTLKINVPGQKPFLKKGSYFFDADNAQWYRITNLKNEDTPTPQIEFMPPARNRIRRLMTLPGVVFVYTMDDPIPVP